MIQLPQQPVYLIIQGTDLILRTRPILNFFNLVDNVRGDLFSPFLALIQIVDLTDMTQPPRTLVVLFVY